MSSAQSRFTRFANGGEAVLSVAVKNVYYLLRRLSKSGASGEWSETIEATVNG